MTGVQTCALPICFPVTISEKMIEYEYEFIITKDEMKARKMATTIKNWYKNSCSLRFVQVIESDGTENKHYKNIVSQMESWK